MSDEEKRRAKCNYYGSVTHRFKQYACCSCSKCCEQFKDGKEIGSCGCIVESRPDLAFFQAHPNRPFDSYYCGCKGWD